MQDRPFKITCKAVLATMWRLAAIPTNRFARGTPAERRRWSRRGVAARRKAKRERQRIALRRAKDRHSARWAGFWRRRYGKLACETIRGQMLLAMLPGEWYARSDVVSLIGGNVTTAAWSAGCSPTISCIEHQTRCMARSRALPSRCGSIS
jgi:hypothetical protein